MREHRLDKKYAIRNVADYSLIDGWIQKLIERKKNPTEKNLF